MSGAAALDVVRETLSRHELLRSLTERQIKARYKQTALGAAWAVLQPLMLMLICSFVFGQVARVPTDEVPYPVFAYAGLIFWSFLTTSIGVGTTVLVGNAELVRKIYFPRELLPLSVVLSGLVDLIASGGLLLVLMAWYGVPFRPWQFLALPVFLVQVVFTVGVVLVTSAVHVRFRDIGHAIPIALQVWMLASPVAYPLAVVPERLRQVFSLNPMAPILEAYRAVLLYGRAPDWSSLSIAAGLALVILIAGYRQFKRAEAVFADII